jgi:DNA-repair protein XRCC3
MIHTTTASQLSHRKVSSGCAVLDAKLGGGIDLAPVTEFVGEAGVGKSQLLMNLALSACADATSGGLAGWALYISTEGPVALTRLSELAGARFPDRALDFDPLDRILVHVVSEAEELWKLLVDTLPLILQRGHVRVVVIDSIAAVFRGEFANDAEGMVNRNSWYFGLSGILKSLSTRYQVMFAVANQVSMDPESGRPKPALGLVWSHCVNQRYLLEFAEAPSADHASERPRPQCQGEQAGVRRFAPRKRSLTVLFSPFRADGLVASCVVAKQGLVGI